MNNENNNNDNNNTEETEWKFGFGTICTWGDEVYSVNFLPSIEYLHNHYNRGLAFTFLGFGFFIGSINATLINAENENNDE